MNPNEAEAALSPEDRELWRNVDHYEARRQAMRSARVAAIAVIIAVAEGILLFGVAAKWYLTP